jgi:hypothetical protein
LLLTYCVLNVNVEGTHTSAPDSPFKKKLLRSFSLYISNRLWTTEIHGENDTFPSDFGSWNVISVWGCRPPVGVRLPSRLRNSGLKVCRSGHYSATSLVTIGPTVFEIRKKKFRLWRFLAPSRGGLAPPFQFWQTFLPAYYVQLQHDMRNRPASGSKCKLKFSLRTHPGHK